MELAEKTWSVGGGAGQTPPQESTDRAQPGPSPPAPGRSSLQGTSSLSPGHLLLPGGAGQERGRVEENCREVRKWPLARAPSENSRCPPAPQASHHVCFGRGLLLPKAQHAMCGSACQRWARAVPASEPGALCPQVPGRAAGTLSGRGPFSRSPCRSTPCTGSPGQGRAHEGHRLGALLSSGGARAPVPWGC